MLKKVSDSQIEKSPKLDLCNAFQIRQLSLVKFQSRKQQLLNDCILQLLITAQI